MRMYVCTAAAIGVVTMAHGLRATAALPGQSATPCLHATSIPADAMTTSGTTAPASLQEVPAEPLPPITATGPHAYYDALNARPDCVASYSLRDQAQLTLYAASSRRPLAVTYDPLNDTDPRRQDAAKIVIPADKASLPNQVRLPIPPVVGDTLVVTWDAWWGSEFRYDVSALLHYKNFQFASPKDRIWTEVRSRFKLATSPDIAKVDVRSYGTLGDTLGANVYDKLPLTPQVGQFTIKPETWTRYWAQFKPAGEWHEFSLWTADASRDPVLVIDRLLIKPNPTSVTGTWESFWLEYNSSQQLDNIPVGRGPLVAYARNVVMLRGVPDVTALFARPLP